MAITATKYSTYIELKITETIFDALFIKPIEIRSDGNITHDFLTIKGHNTSRDETRYYYVPIMYDSMALSVTINDNINVFPAQGGYSRDENAKNKIDIFAFDVQGRDFMLSENDVCFKTEDILSGSSIPNLCNKMTSINISRSISCSYDFEKNIIDTNEGTEYQNSDCKIQIIIDDIKIKQLLSILKKTGCFYFYIPENSKTGIESSIISVSSVSANSINEYSETENVIFLVDISFSLVDKCTIYY